MWQNIKYYALALTIILITTIVSTGLQLLENAFPTGHPASSLATNLSGVTLGIIIMVIGFLRDSRLDQALKRADTAEAKIVEAQVKTAVAEAMIKQERERADLEHERAERYLAELERYRESYERTTETLIQTLREINANRSTDADPC